MPKTPTPASEAPTRNRPDRKQLGMLDPIFIGFYQTVKTDIFETFTGLGAYQRACDWADAAAQGTPDRKAVVFGPQSEIFAYAPPRAARMKLADAPAVSGAGE